MKKLLIGLLALGSISAFADDCTFTTSDFLPGDVIAVLKSKNYEIIEGSTGTYSLEYRRGIWYPVVDKHSAPAGHYNYVKLMKNKDVLFEDTATAYGSLIRAFTNPNRKSSRVSYDRLIENMDAGIKPCPYRF